MRVSLLNDSFPPVIDGVANTVMNYAEILTETKKAEVIVGTPRYPDAEYDQYPYPVVPYHSINTAALVHGYRAGNPMDRKAIRKLMDFQADIIHTHCPVSSTVLARMIRSELDAPVIFTYHTKFDVDIARAVHAKFLQKESVKVLVDNITACDEVWVVSRGAGENLRSLGYEGEYRIMSNGVDFPKGRTDAQEVQSVTGAYDLPEGVPVFLFVGRIMKYKGLPIILDALKRLQESGMDYRMVFIGGGADQEEMQQSAEDLGISNRVIFTGPIQDREALRAWNTRADLFLFPSTYDTNGIVVREAAACGLASVLIRDSCAAEGITDGRNGYLIEENAESMAACLQRVCQELAQVHQTGQQAMDEIYISWEDAVTAAYERYHEVLDLKKSGVFQDRKKETFDYLAEFAAGLVNKTGALIHMPQKLYEDVEEAKEAFRETTSQMVQGANERRQQKREQVAEIKAQMKERTDQLREKTVETYEKQKEKIKEKLKGQQK